jgi:uncharacterized sulfatase
MHRHLLTGLHPRTTLVQTWGTLAEEMVDSGRRTFQAGKLWDQSAARWGFQQHAGERCAETGLSCGSPDFGRAGWDVTTCGIFSAPATPCPATQAWRDFLATIDQANDERFFAMFTPLLPHHPYDPPQEYVTLYTGQPMAADEPVYLPMITWFDEVVGEIMADLDASGMRDDTLVVYLADNGFRSDVSLFQHAFPETMRGKSSLSEMGMRSPVILSWPADMRSTQGVMLAGVVGIEDVVATLLEISGRPVPAGIQGYDLQPSWTNGTPSPRAEIVTRYQNGVDPSQPIYVDGWVVRTSQWRFIWDLETGTEYLYAIDLDPDEEVNLAPFTAPADLLPFHTSIDAWVARN